LVFDHRGACVLGALRRTGHDLEDTPHGRPPRSGEAQEGEADTIGDADGADVGAAPEADGAADPDADGAAEPEAAGELLGAVLTAGDGEVAGFCVRKPPWPPRSP
jgi:hypothetical protein